MVKTPSFSWIPDSPDDLFAKRGTRATVQGIDIVFVADVHQRVTTVRSEARRRPPVSGQIDGEVVPVREGEWRVEHQHTVVALVNAKPSRRAARTAPFQEACDQGPSNKSR